MKYSIYGSCVTRDIFGINNKDDVVGSYIARASLHSLFGKGTVGFSDNSLGIERASWNERMLYTDVYKEFSIESDVLIVDFIDERFRVLSSGSVLFTESLEFQKRELSDLLGAKKAFNRGCEAEMIHWIESCFNFKTYVNKNSIKVILHKAYFAKSYRNKNGNLVDLERLEYIDFCNKLLRFYYTSFENIVSPIASIDVDLTFRVADEAHKWGVAPFHYVGEYYRAALQQLNEISRDIEA